MATNPVVLPPGFKLDSDNAPAGVVTPPGFTLDRMPSFPKGHQPANLPNITNEQLASTLPYVGGAIGGILAPEGVLIGMGASALGGMLGKGAEQALTDKPIDPKEIALSGLEQGATELGGRGIQKIAGAILGHYFKPSRMYQSSVMPPPSWGKEKIGRLVKAGMEENIPASEAGFAKAGQSWRDLNSQIEGQIAANPGLPVDPKQATQGLNDLRLKWTQGSGDPAFLSQINEVEQNFQLRHPKMTGADAQATKKALYNEVRLQNQNAWDVSKPLPLDLQAKQVIAEGLKEQLEVLYPGIKEMNAKEGALIELERALNRFVAREGNKRITGYFGPVAAGGLMLAHQPEAAVGVFASALVRNALEDPAVKSRLAVVLSRIGQNPGAKTAGKVAGKVFNPQNAVRAIGAWMPPPPPPGQ